MSFLAVGLSGVRFDPERPALDRPVRQAMDSYSRSWVAIYSHDDGDNQHSLRG